MHLIRGVSDTTEEQDTSERSSPVQLPAPGYARSRGDVHVVADLQDQRHPLAACGVWLTRAELWRRRPDGRLCPGCFGSEAVAAALPRP